jgi:hypothetical protein
VVVALEHEPGVTGERLAPGVTELGEGRVGLLDQAQGGIAGTAPLQLGPADQELDSEGRFVGTTTEQGSLTRYLSIRDRALADSMELSAYTARATRR